MRARFFAAFAVAMVVAGATLPVQAVEPDEILSNPVLEARARTISEGLRCLVCQNESIDDSHAGLARDIRLLVRRRLEAGDTNQQIRDYLVSRYGAFILLRPPVEWGTLLLWTTPILVLVLGASAAMLASRRSRKQTDPALPLSASEQQRLDDLLSSDSPGS